MTARVAAWMQGAMSFRKTTDGRHIVKVAIAAAGALLAPDGSPVQPVVVVPAGSTFNGAQPIAGSTTIAEGGPTLWVDVLSTTALTAPNGKPIIGILDPDATIGTVAAPTSTFAMTQLPDANRIYQRTTLVGGGQGKGQTIVPVTISGASAGTIAARCRDAADGTTIVQAEWSAATITNGATTALISGVDARLGWFYLDLKDSSGTWKLGTVPIGVGALYAWAGQSLMSRMIGRVDGSGGTYASQGITPSPYSSAMASCHDGNVYEPTVATMPWQLPGDWADNAGVNSVGIGTFLNDAIATLGINCGVIGHAHGGVYLGQYLSGQSDWTRFAATIARAGGAFEGFFWGQGHSDSSVGTPAVAYKAQLDILYAQVAAINSFAGFKTYIWTIPAVGSNTLGTSWQYTQVRKGALDWCAANGATYVHAYDLQGDGVHQNNSSLGSGWLGRTMWRATRADYGLSSGLGPSLVSATRAGQAITLTLSDVGQTNLVLVGSAKDLFFVFRPGESNNKDAAINDNRYPVSAVAVTNKTTLTLTLANDPGVGQALDLWFSYGIISVLPESNYITDDRTDDGLPRGRQLQANFAPIVVAAPTPGGAQNAPPTVAARVSPQALTGAGTYAAGMAGFGQERTSGNLSSSGISLPAFTYEGFITCPALGTKVIINGLPGGDWLGLAGGVLTINAAQNGATTLTPGHRYHFAYVRGSTGQRIYLQDITAASTGVRDYNSNTPIGTTWGGGPGSSTQLGHLNGGFAFDGALDEFAVFFGERYTGATYAAPTTPYTGAEPNLMCLWHLDGNGNEAIQH